MFFYTQETGFIFELHNTLFPEACLFEEKYFLHLPLRLILGGNPVFRHFSGTNRAHKLKRVKTGVIERVSANQVVHDAICHHFVIEHVCDGTITMTLIIDIGIATSRRSVIVPPYLTYYGVA